MEKRDYFEKKLKHKVDNSKCLWEGVKSFLGWKTGGAPDLIISGKGEALQEPQEMANEIQNSFQQKSKEVEQSLGKPYGNYLRVVRNMTRGRCRVFRFMEVSREQVISQIRAAPNKDSMVIDKISYNVLKMLDIHIAGSLKKIINLSLQIRKYPRAWSVSILKPQRTGQTKGRCHY